MSTAQLLPPAVEWDKERLSPQARTALDALVGRDPRSFGVQLLLAWAVIVGMMLWAMRAHSVWVSVLAIVVIATRQNILGLLVHEQAHCLAFKARPGDLLVNLVAGYPMLVLTVEGYAQVHLNHHRFFFTEQDPDFLRKSGPDWAAPLRKRRLAWLFLTDVLALNVVKLVRGKRTGRPGATFQREGPPKAVRLGFYAVALGLISWFGLWPTVLLYWLLPLITVTQVIIRLGALSEHRYNLAGARVEDATPFIIPPLWQRLLLPNLNFTFHAYHHFFPGVPFARLRQVHRIFQREGLVNEARVFRGYGAFLRALASVAPRD